MDKRFKVSNTKNTEEYLSRLQEIEGLTTVFKQRKIDAENEAARIESQIKELSVQIVLISDMNEIKKVSDKRRELQARLEDLKLIQETDVKSIVLSKYEELKAGPVSREADKEYDSFTKMIRSEIKRVEEEAKKTIEELEDELTKHPYREALATEEMIVEIKRGFRKV